MRKKLVCLVLCAIFAFAGTASAHSVSVDYDYNASVKEGRVRYVAQLASDAYYHQDYWGCFASYSSNECGTACISMALSYIGVAATPEELGNYWLSKGYTAGVPFSTNFYDVPYAHGGHTFDFRKAYERYEQGGGYSPVIIYLTQALNPYQTGNRHFVMLVGKKDDITYEAIDPARSDLVRDIVIKDNGSGSFLVSLESKSGALLQETVTEGELCAAQYYLETTKDEDTAKEPAPESEEPGAANGQDGGREKDEEALTRETAKLDAATIEEAKQEAAKEEPKMIKTPDLAYPLGGEMLSATRSLNYLDVRIVFADTGADTYTIYLRRAVDKGDRSVMSDEEEYLEEPFVCTVGDGFTQRYQGQIIVSPPICLRAGYVYRYYVMDAFGAGSNRPAYGYTGN